MPRLSTSVPNYRKHKQSGQAIVTLNGRDFVLGPHGTKASRIKYDRLIAEWLDRDRQPMGQKGVGLLVCELVSRYWTHAEKRHTKNGQPAAALHKLKTAIRHLLRLYENHPAADFAPMHLKVVRQEMIESG